MIGEALARATAQLADVSGSARLDAQVLLAHVLGLERGQLGAREAQVLGEAERQTFEGLLVSRARGVPIAYLVGSREFWTLRLEVDAAVLVPRPETELLVELALERLHPLAQPHALDLGTGSGAIGLAIASERADARVDLVDASAAALAVAERNRARLGLGNARTLLGHWYGPVAGSRYALIAANPPYLSSTDPHLATAELAHEPVAALVAGTTGLESLEEIARGAPGHLEAGGVLLLEHGATQGAATRALMARAGLEAIETRRDLAGLERATLGVRAG